MPKPVKVLLALILILTLTTITFRHPLTRLLIEQSTARASGLRLSIEQINLNLFASSLSLRGIRLFNPPGFKNSLLGQAQEIFIQYYPLSLLSGRIHLRLFRLDVDEINIITNEKGESNVAGLKQSRSKAKSPTVAAKAQSVQEQAQQGKVEAKQKIRPNLLIDRLELSVKKVVFIDYTAEAEQPAVIIFTVKGPSVFTNVSDLGYVVQSVSIQGGFKTVLDGLLNKVRRDILKNGSDTLKKKVGNILSKIEPKD